MKCNRCGEENPAEIHTCSPQMRGGMTRDDVLRMAVECQLMTTGNRDGVYADALERFAALVAQHEREQCAKVCDSEATIEGMAQRCAEEIRKRGEK